MPEQRGARRLNIPIYETDAAPVAEGEEVLEAEVIEPRDLFGGIADSVRTGARRVRDHGVRDATRQAAEDLTGRRGRGARGQEREQARAGREERSRTRRAQSAYDRARARKVQEDASRAAADPMASLRFQTSLAGAQYMESLRRSGILDESQTKASQKLKLSELQGLYASRMVMQCIAPLQQGMNASSVLSVVGMGTMMWAMSPNFRAQVGAYAGDVRDAITKRIESRTEKMGEKARAKRDGLAAKGHEDRLANKWRKMLDKAEHAERGHREPFTAQSAAMTEVALAEAAYMDMRRPGADVKVVKDRYESALTALYEYAEDDGLDREEVSRGMRVLIGQRLEQEPQLASVFSELGHGRFSRSEPREVVVAGTGDRVTAWTGDFEDAFEGRLVSKGSFSLRTPMDAVEHRAMMAQTIAGEMVSATSAGELNDVLSQYLVGSAALSAPELVDQVEDPVARRRLGKARTMAASMAQDGFGGEAQRFAYSAAYVDAMQLVQQANPELGRQWAAQYGESWRETVAERLREYSDLGRTGKEPGGYGEHAAYEPWAPEYRADGDYTDIVDAEVVEDEAEAGAEPSQGGTQAEAVVEEEIEDVEIVEDEDEAGSSSAPLSARERAQLLLHEMADRFADGLGPDPKDPSASGGALGVVNGLEALRERGAVLDGRLSDADAVDAVQRDRIVETMREMRSRMEEIGIVNPRSQDLMHSLAAISGIERAASRHPLVQRVAMGGTGAPATRLAWREQEYRRMLDGGAHDHGDAEQSYQETLAVLEGSDAVRQLDQGKLLDGLDSGSSAAAYRRSLALRRPGERARQARIEAARDEPGFDQAAAWHEAPKGDEPQMGG